MRKAIILACCMALMGSVSVASARTTMHAGPQAIKSHDPMNANAMTKKHKKKSMSKSDMGKGDKGMEKGMTK